MKTSKSCTGATEALVNKYSTVLYFAEMLKK